MLEDLFEQLSGIVKNVDRHGKTALFLIMTDSCLRIIQAKTKAVHRRKSVNNATISYIYGYLKTAQSFCQAKVLASLLLYRPQPVLKYAASNFNIPVFR